MRFSIVSLLALAASAVAQTPGFDAITHPNKTDIVKAGSTFNITWLPDAKHSGIIDITLLGGSSPQTLQVVNTLASNVSSSIGFFTWNVCRTLGSNATYGIKISLSSDPTIFQFSNPFSIVRISLSSSLASSSSTKSRSSLPKPTDSEAFTVVASYTNGTNTTLSSKPATSPTTIISTYPNVTVTRVTATATNAGPATVTPSSSPVTRSGSTAQHAVSLLSLVGALAVAVFAL